MMDKQEFVLGDQNHVLGIDGKYDAHHALISITETAIDFNVDDHILDELWNSRIWPVGDLISAAVGDLI